MTIRKGVGLMRAIKTAISGKGPLFALALAGIGIQGCITDVAPAGPAAEESSSEGPSLAARAASSGADVTTRDIGGGCTFHTIVADAGSRARGQAWISCNKRKSSLTLAIALGQKDSKNRTSTNKSCKNVYWCGTGNIYVNDPSGTQTFSVAAVTENFKSTNPNDRFITIKAMARF